MSHSLTIKNSATATAEPPLAHGKFEPSEWVEIVRAGKWRNHEPQTLTISNVAVTFARGVWQEISEDDLDAILSAWRADGSPELLLDQDHFSMSPDHASDALGWVVDMERRGASIFGRVRYSSEGLDKVQGGVLRYTSPVMPSLITPEDMEALTKEIAPLLAIQGGVKGWAQKRVPVVYPTRLTSVALTNTPAMRGMAPVANRATQETPGGGEPPLTKPNKETKHMDLKALAALLGLPETATEADVSAAISALIEGKTAAEKEATEMANRAANAWADNNASKIKNRAPWIAAYIKDPNAAQAMLDGTDATQPQPQQQEPQAKPNVSVFNRAAAKPPVDPDPAALPEKGDPGYAAAVVNRFNQLATDRSAQSAFYRKHEAVLRNAFRGSPAKR